MKKLIVIASVLLGIGVLSGCDDPPDPRLVQQQDCFEKGGVYFEYENTSAGAHIWCVNGMGKDVDLSYRGDN